MIMLYILIILSCTSSYNNGDIQSYTPHENLVHVSLFSPRKPAKIAEWRFTPDIRVCDFAPVSRDRVSEAIKWWKDRGYEFGIITYGGIWGGCTSGSMHVGVITVSLSGQGYDFSSLGRTTIHHRDGQMLKAEIEVSQQTGNKDRILEHEIGHALGWDHFNKRRHILHPRWESGGYLDDFVRNDYQRSDLEGD